MTKICFDGGVVLRFDHEKREPAFQQDNPQHYSSLATAHSTDALGTRHPSLPQRPAARPRPHIVPDDWHGGVQTNHKVHTMDPYRDE